VIVPTHAEWLGSSAQGRPITAVVRGYPTATRSVLVIGVVHGTEPAGIAVIRALRYAAPPPGVRYWLVAAANPDGLAHGTRQNARGVDLNRNFPLTWVGGGRPFDTYYPGRAAGSEPETRAIMRLIARVHPDVTVWYHQHLGIVVRPSTRHARQIAAAYARASGIPMRQYLTLQGTASAWEALVDPLSAPLVVELRAGALGPAGVRRQVRAVRAAAVLAARTPRPAGA
jgi:protein MpaA